MVQEVNLTQRPVQADTTNSFLVRQKIAGILRRVSLCCLLLIAAISAFGLPRQSAEPPEKQAPVGIIVEKVAPGSGWDKAGIQAGDVLLSYNERPLSGNFSLTAAIQNAVTGTWRTVKALRGDRKIQTKIAFDATGLYCRWSSSPAIMTPWTEGQEEIDAKNWLAAVEKYKSAYQVANAAGIKPPVAFCLQYLHNLFEICLLAALISVL